MKYFGMGPVAIAVDSYGPVTDNAQSVFELSQIEQIKGIKKSIEKEYVSKYSELCTKYNSSKQKLDEIENTYFNKTKNILKKRKPKHML